MAIDKQLDGEKQALTEPIDAIQFSALDEYYLESTRILRERLTSNKNGGKRIPAEEVFDKLSKKFGINFK